MALTLRVYNVSNLAPVSDYIYEVYVGEQQIATGSIAGHTRADGWAVLVKKIVDEHIAAGFTGALTRTLTDDDLAEKKVIACGKTDSPKGYKICVKPRGHKTRCKFVSVVPAPAGAR